MNKSDNESSWSQIIHCPGVSGKRFGSIRDLPVRYPEKVPHELYKSNRILDIGLGGYNILFQNVSVQRFYIEIRKLRKIET